MNINELLEEIKKLHEDAQKDLEQWSYTKDDTYGNVGYKYSTLCYEAVKEIEDGVWTITREDGRTRTVNGSTVFLINTDILNGVDDKGYHFGHSLYRIKSIVRAEIH